jgi:hypothetical protein
MVLCSLALQAKKKSIDLSFHGRRFTWTFLLAAVQFPFLGVDFLRHFKLLVDPATNHLVDTCSLQTFATVSSTGGSPLATAVSSLGGLLGGTPSPITASSPGGVISSSSATSHPAGHRL